MGSSFEIFLNVVSARMEIAVLRHKCYHKLYCYHIVKNFFREGRLKVDKSQYLTTGELAKLMHVTKNTLFHYDKIGLFSPEIVLDNEYRYYSIHQIEVLEAIIMLKELGMSLKEIQAFLSDRTPEKLLELFEKEERILTEKIRLLKDRRQWMEEKSKKVRGYLDKAPDEIFICEKPGRYYLMDAFLDVSESEFAERTAELINFYENNSKSICYEIGYIQYAKDVRRQIYANYSNVILLMKHKPGGMSCHFMPAGKYLTTYFKGHWRNIGEAYRKLLAYADEHQITLAEEFLEVYTVDQLMAETVEEYVTEISVRICGGDMDEL